MRATIRRFAFVSLCMLALLLLLVAIGGSEGRRQRLREATRLLFGDALVLLVGPASPAA